MASLIGPGKFLHQWRAGSEYCSIGQQVLDRYLDGNMGAGASSEREITDAEELQIYNAFKKKYDDKLAESADMSEDDKQALFDTLKQEFVDALPPHIRRASKLRKLVRDDTTRAFEPETSSNNLSIGDIVKAKPNGESLYYEGIVVSCNIEEQLYDIDFSEDDVERAVPRNNIRRILPWDELEVGDVVDARAGGGRMYFQAIVMDVDAAKEQYELKYDDDEVEKGVRRDLIRKLRSHRQQEEEMFEDAGAQPGADAAAAAAPAAAPAAPAATTGAADAAAGDAAAAPSEEAKGE